MINCLHWRILKIFLIVLIKMFSSQKETDIFICIFVSLFKCKY